MNALNLTKCSFCKCVGHKINKCRNPKIKELDEHMMNVCIITKIFPFIKNKFIMSELESKSVNELKVLTYLFEIDKREKFYMKKKEDLINLLSCCYNSIASVENETNAEYLRTYITKFYLNFELNILDPNRIPDTTLIRKFADYVYQKMPDNQKDYFKICIWIARKLETYHNNYLIYMKSITFISHKFDIILCVTENAENAENSEETESFECPICQEEIIDEKKNVQTGCSHKYCTPCINLQLETLSKNKEKRDPLCALCRHPIEILKFKNFQEASKINEKYIVGEKLIIDLAN